MNVTQDASKSGLVIYSLETCTLDRNEVYPETKYSRVNYPSFDTMYGVLRFKIPGPSTHYAFNK
jgi:hypothetical protein